MAPPDPPGRRNSNFDDQPTVTASIEIATTSPRRGKPYALEQTRGPGAPREFHLLGSVVVLGRSHDADISIESTRISRRHMQLRRDGPEFTFIDLNSSNGVYLNGVKAHQAVLREGDTLQLGDVVLVFHEGSS